MKKRKKEKRETGERAPRWRLSVAVLLIALSLTTSGCLGVGRNPAGPGPVDPAGDAAHRGPALSLGLSYDLSEGDRLEADVSFRNLRNDTEIRNLSGTLYYIEDDDTEENWTFSIRTIPPNSSKTVSTIFSGSSGADKDLRIEMNSSVGGIEKRYGLD